MRWANLDALWARETTAVEKNEPGVLAYIAYRSSTNPDLLTFYEIYENQEAVKNHGKQPHLAVVRESFAKGILMPFSAETTVKVERLDLISGFSR